MPRYPKGTRKNTNTSEKNNTRKEKLSVKLNKCIEEKNKYKDSRDPRQHMKYLKLSQEIMKIHNDIENLDDTKRLEESVIEGIIEQFADNLDVDVKNEIKSKLAKMTYDKKYRSCFSGKPSINLYHQAVDKLSCFIKYGDKIE
jgi:hypothetical protein